MNNVKLLSIDHSEEIFEILQHHQKISRIPYVEGKEEFTSKIQDTFSNPNIRCIGYYENNKLTSFLFQLISDKIPAWHMTLLGTISKHGWNYKKNGLDDCWKNAMEYAENLKIFRLYWALPEKWARTQKRTINLSEVWNRYDIYYESLVPSNQYPEWPEYRPSFGQNTKPHNTIIKLGVLKNEYRKFD